MSHEEEKNISIVLLTTSTVFAGILIFTMGYYHGKDVAYESMGFVDPAVSIEMDACSDRVDEIIASMDVHLAGCYDDLNELEDRLDSDTVKKTGGK